MSFFSFGSDPEFMIVKNGQLKNAIDVLPSKEKAIVFENNKFYYDNVLAEIAVNPSYTKDGAVKNIKNSLASLAKIIYPMKFKIQAADNYPSEEINCNKAKIASCIPELGIYSLAVVKPPKSLIEFRDENYYFKSTIRTAGGHIHLGSETLKNVLDLINVVKMMDLFIGIPSIFLDSGATSKIRRSCYGLAGTHRVPDEIGRVEYRTLSNFWFSSPDHVELIYDLCDFVLDFVKQKKHQKFWSVDESKLDEDPINAHFCYGYDVDALINSINNCDKIQAAKFMTIVENFVDENIMNKIEALKNVELPDPYETWGINV